MWPFSSGKSPEEQRGAAPVKKLVQAPAEADSGADYLTDAPIENATQDSFGRRNWANRVAVTIAAQQDPASLVVGIYGPWGDGKTSVLNLIDNALGARPLECSRERVRSRWVP